MYLKILNYRLNQSISSKKNCNPHASTALYQVLINSRKQKMGIKAIPIDLHIEMKKPIPVLNYRYNYI